MAKARKQEMCIEGDFVWKIEGIRYKVSKVLIEHERRIECERRLGGGIMYFIVFVWCWE